MPSMLCIILLLVYVAATSSKTVGFGSTTKSLTPEEGEDENQTEVVEEDDDDYEEVLEDNVEKIYGSCVEELYEITAVVASGKYLLIYDPEEVPCINMVVEQKKKGTLEKKHQWERKECLPAYTGWNWYGNFLPGEENIFRISDARDKTSLLHQRMYFLPETPPPVAAVEAEVGKGFVMVYITAPEEKGPSLLGYSVSLLDAERSSEWRVVGVFENVVYHCMLPELWPVHPCPEWNTTRVFCALFSDPVWWTNNDSRRITNDTMKYVEVKTFRIPTDEKDRIYSKGVKIPLYKLQPEVDPTESGFAEGSEGEEPSGVGSAAEGELWEDAAWAVFLALTLALLAGALPLLHRLAVRDGRNDARSLWNGQICGHSPISNSFTNCLECCFHNKISYEGKERLRFRGFKRKGPHPAPDPDAIPETKLGPDLGPDPDLGTDLDPNPIPKSDSES